MTSAVPLAAQDTLTTPRPRHLHSVPPAPLRSNPSRSCPITQPHGTPSRFRRCADGPGGKACLPCRAAYCQDEVRRRREKRHGYDRWTDALPVYEHLQKLLAKGSLAAVAREAELSWDTVRYVANGLPRSVIVDGNGEAVLYQKRVHRNTAVAILAVTPEQITACRADEVPARSTQRLIEGMAAQGWDLEWQSRAAGLPRQACSKAMHAVRISKANADAIERLSEQVGDRQGPSARARGLARRRKWLPLAWGTDEEIAELRRITHKALADPMEPREPSRRSRASA